MAHEHGQTVDAQSLNRTAFRWAVLINAGYVVIEAAAGLMFGSMALLADAAHNLVDVAGLLIAWGAAIFATWSPTERFTYGFGRTTILAALANTLLILMAVGMVIWESVSRLAAAPALDPLPVLIIAAIGILVNGGTAALFLKHRHSDLNVRGAFLHMAADAAVSFGVMLAAAGIAVSGWYWLDPAMAIAVSLVIAWAAFDLLKASLHSSLDAVPASVDRRQVEAWLAARPGVESVHDLHIWPLSTTRIALTGHLVMPPGHPGDEFLEAIASELEQRYGISHITLQVEIGDGSNCTQKPPGVV